MLMLLPQHIHPLNGKLAKLTRDEDVATAHDDEDPGKPQQVVSLLRGRAGQGTLIVFRWELHSAVGLQTCNTFVVSVCYMVCLLSAFPPLNLGWFSLLDIFQKKWSNSTSILAK